MKTEPSRRQLELLTFIADYLVAHRYPPTLREMCVYMNVGSTNAVHDMLHSMMHKKLVERDPGALSRGLRITDHGWSFIPAAPQTIVSGPKTRPGLAFTAELAVEALDLSA